jgi:hypothetical protein
VGRHVDLDQYWCVRTRDGGWGSRYPTVGSGGH